MAVTSQFREVKSVQEMGCTSEGVLFRELYAQFHRIAQAVAPKLPSLLGRGMHTSETKIIDNAIVGYVLEELR